MGDSGARGTSYARGRARNVRELACSVEQVFAVLADGWLYPSWVVGASRMRDVEVQWPGRDARLHHSFGVWPILIDDTTVCLVWDPPRRAVLRARGWPIGEAEVLIEARPQGAGCIVRIHERPVRGPATLLPSFLSAALLRWRNAETLHRLGYLAEGGASASRGTHERDDQGGADVDDDMTRDEKRRDQLLSAPDATEADAEERVVVSEVAGVTRVDIAPDADVRPGAGPGMPEAENRERLDG